MIPVDAGVPLPPEPARTPWPFDEMRVNESFEVPADLTLRLRWAAGQNTRRTGKRYSVRVDREAGMVRCWRVS
jgi:hypothetical protein